MAAPIIRNKRSSVPGKVPTATDLSFGEFGVNTYDGKIFISASNAVVGVGTTVITVNPWSVGIGSTAYNTYFNAGNVGIGTTNPQQKLHVLGNVLVAAGSSTDQYITQKPYELNNGTLSWEGSAGQLFSITNNLSTGSIFSVNDISGIPSIDVDAGGAITLGAYGGNIGVGTTNPTSKLHVVGNVLVSGIVTATTFVGNLTGTATTADISTNLKGGLAGNVVYQSAPDTTTFLPNGTGGFILQSNGVGSAPTWVASAPAGAVTGLVIRDFNNTIVGSSGSVTQLTFGSGLSVTGTAGAAGIATITLYSNIVGTSLSISGISTFTNGPVFIGAATSTGTASQPLQVTGGAYVSGNLGIGTTNPTSKLHVVGNALVSGNIGIGTTNPTSPLHVIGIVTASSYYGDGYNLSRTRQSYQYNNTIVGSGTTLNFIGAGVSSVTLLNDIVTVNIPNTVRTTNTYTATLNQTTFSATYNLGFVDVYLNGSKLSSDQYTATTGTNIVLETGASLGDIVDIIGYMTYKVAGTQTILSDTVFSTSGITTSYTGLADQGSSQSANVWTIRRSVFTSAGILSTTASALNVAWINRLSVTYT